MWHHCEHASHHGLAPKAEPSEAELPTWGRPDTIYLVLKYRLVEHIPFKFMLDEVENNSSVFRECVSGALIKRSLAEPKKQPRRRATSGAHKRASKKLEHDEDEASDLAEFAEVWLIKINISCSDWEDQVVHRCRDIYLFSRGSPKSLVLSYPEFFKTGQ